MLCCYAVRKSNLPQGVTGNRKAPPADGRKGDAIMKDILKALDPRGLFFIWIIIIINIFFIFIFIIFIIFTN